MCLAIIIYDFAANSEFFSEPGKITLTSASTISPSIESTPYNTSAGEGVVSCFVIQSGPDTAGGVSIAFEIFQSSHKISAI
jgi:hypothetical protein